MPYVPEGFWGVRKALSDDDFALVRPGRPPSDYVDESTWESVMMLPDDVAIRTCQNQGSIVQAAVDIQRTWINLGAFFSDTNHPAALEEGILCGL